MANELNLYRVRYTVHRRRLDGRKRQRSSDDRWTVGDNAEEAVRKRLAHVERFDRPLQGWTTVRIESTSVEQVGILRRCVQCSEFRADEHGILCVCSGLRCRRCGQPRIHRPVSDYYDERDGHLWHVPWFCTPSLCDDCDPVKRLTARAWGTALHLEPRARPHSDWNALDTFFGSPVQPRHALVGRHGGLSELLRRLVKFQKDSSVPTAKTFVVTFHENDDRDAYLLFVAIAGRATVACEAGRLEHLIPGALTGQERAELLGRGFALSESSQAGRREIETRGCAMGRPRGHLRARGPSMSSAIAANSTSKRVSRPE